jgi:glycosyltransferase involved in cell wall biosynthesis
VTILYGGFVDLAANKGDAVHAMELTRNFGRLGNRVVMIAHSSKKRRESDFYDTGVYEAARTLGSKLVLFLLSVLRAAKWILLLSPACDVLYMRDYIFCALALPAKLLYSKRVIWEVNGIAWHERSQKAHPVNLLVLPIIRLLDRLARLNADRILPVSRGVMNVLLASGCSASKVALLENGVNVDMFSGDLNSSVVVDERVRLGIESSIPVVCYVGAIRPWQGLEVLVSAARDISHRCGDARFLVVGGGEELEGLKSFADEKGLYKFFIFTGFIPYDRVPMMMALSSVCVAPFAAGRAASPMKVYEYMAAGRPVVASRISGLEFVEEENLGMLVDPGDAGGLADAVVFLLENPEAAEEMSLRAREYVLRNHSWQSVARKALSICQDVQPGRRSRYQ